MIVYAIAVIPYVLTKNLIRRKGIRTNMNILEIEILDNEYWYGGVITEGDKMPFTKQSDYVFDFSKTHFEDQATTIFISNKGRYFKFEPILIKISNGKILVAYEKIIPSLKSLGNTLKTAYQGAYIDYFYHDKTHPTKDCFVYPQFNDWMEIGYNQNQADILKYAHEIIDKKYPYSVLMIDDKWMDYYGAFSFNKERFPSPQEMINELHLLGFKLMLWETPFVSPDSPEFRELDSLGVLIKKGNGEVAIRKWWNGYSAILDLSNPIAIEWLNEKNDKLLKMGIDGFKFDAGDFFYYKNDDVVFGSSIAEEQAKKYFEFGYKYEYNEFRAAINVAGYGTMFRQCDKAHTFDKGGLRDLVYGCVIQNLMGYWFSAPDMVGGGAIGTDKVIDEELVVRYAQASALMPMMQFSRLPHKILSEENFEICLRFANLHVSFGEYIYKQVQKATEFGEPIVKLLEYEFPNQGYENELNAFVLGDKFLVFPVIKKGEFKKEIKLPEGKWKYFDGTVYKGGKFYLFETPIEVLPYFEKID